MKRAFTVKQKPRGRQLFLAMLALGCIFGRACPGLAKSLTIDLAPKPLPAKQAALLKVADDLLEQALVSYVYGGHRVGDGAACESCNNCLEANRPQPKERLKKCPVCRDCSLDCSHFVQMVLNQAGLPLPFIETALMRSLSAERLLKGYHLVDVSSQAPGGLQAGDLLVYKGHVVILERTHQDGTFKGDVIHATGGRDIKAPGQGIQRERFINLASFRGPLLRVLRHAGLTNSENPENTARQPKVHTEQPSKTPATSDKGSRKRLRPVAKSSPREP
jgi:cell wall-associated NlpC family hydrolase